jgi:hypothetical protein
MPDRIVYCVVTNAGGIDGLDRSDKGGHIKFASYVKSDAEAKADDWSHVEARVIDPEQVARDVRKKLNPVECLCLFDSM